MVDIFHRTVELSYKLVGRMNEMKMQNIKLIMICLGNLVTLRLRIWRTLNGRFLVMSLTY